MKGWGEDEGEERGTLKALTWRSRKLSIGLGVPEQRVSSARSLLVSAHLLG